MSEMVERVAKAMYDATPFKETEGGLHEQSEVYQRTARMLARAAIEAMREPTEAMVAAVSVQWGDALEHDYKAMIDAALKE